MSEPQHDIHAPSPIPVVVGAVLTGGGSRRFGSDKALAPIPDGEDLLGGRVVKAMREAGIDPVVAVGGQAGTTLGVPTVDDQWPDEGPLGGVVSALLWARRGLVVVAPCDLPNLRSVDVAAVVDKARATEGVAVAASVGGQPQVQLVCLPASLGLELRAALSSGERRYRALFDHGSWETVEVSPASLDDADTPDDLAALTRRHLTDRVPPPRSC